MVLKKESLQSLKQHFNLNIYEAKIWSALLSRGVSCASELADISGVPRSRCYDILESLEKKGFIMMKIGKPIEYIALHPEIIIERLNRDTAQHAAQVIQYMDTIGDSSDFKELDLLYKSGITHVDVTQITKSVISASQITRAIKEMVSSAQQSVTLVTTEQGVPRMAKVLKSVLPLLKKKGVRITLYAPYDKAVAKKIDGAQYVDYHANTEFVSIDGKEMMFMITPDRVVPEYEVGIWIKSGFFVAAVTMLFEQSIK